MSIQSQNSQGHIDPDLLSAALNFYGLPQKYNRFFSKNGSFGHYMPETAAQMNLASWVQMNLPNTELLPTKKAENSDIATVINITLDAEYPKEPSKAHWIGKNLAKYISECGWADPELPVEDSGAGFHIVLPIAPITTAAYGGGDLVNKAVANFVSQKLKEEFNRLAELQGLTGLTKLEAFDISRILSVPGTWRPPHNKPDDADYLGSGYVRRWLEPYDNISVRKPVRVANAALTDEILKQIEILQRPPELEPAVIVVDRRGQVDAGMVALWLEQKYSMMPKIYKQDGVLDRSKNFHKLVSTAWLKFGDDDLITRQADLIDNLTGNKYGHRAYEQVQASLEAAHQLPREDSGFFVQFNTGSKSDTTHKKSTEKPKLDLPSVAELLTEEIPEDLASQEEYLKRVVLSAHQDKSIGPVMKEKLKNQLVERLGVGKRTIANAFKHIEAEADGIEESEPSKNGDADPFKIAMLMVSKYNDILGYDSEAQTWVNWTGTHWLQFEEKKSTVLDRMVTTAVQELGYVARGPLMNDVIRHARVLFERKLEPKAGMVNFKNGTLDTNTMTLHKHDKEDGLEYCYPYDYSATNDCPNFKEYLIDRIPDTGARLTIMEHIGMAFLKDRSLHKVLVLKGEPGSGKTRLLDIVNLLFGLQPGVHASKNTFSGEQEGIRARYEWYNKPICPIDEVPAEAFQNEETFKRLSGHGGADARGMNQNSDTKQWQAKFFMTCNDSPKFQDRSSGVHRRFMIILYNKKIDPKNYDLRLMDKMIPELGAIARLCIEAGKNVYERNGYTITHKMEVTLDSVVAEGDAVKQFVKDRAKLAVKDRKPRDTYTCSGAELYKSFLEWCELNHVKHIPSKPMVTKALRDYAIWELKDKRGASGLVWCGITLLSPGDPEYDSPKSLDDQLAEL